MIDLSPIVAPTLSLCGLAITIFGTLALNTLKNKWGVELSASQRALYQDALQSATSYGIAQSQAMITAHGLDHPIIKDSVAKFGLNYLMTHYSDVLTNVGLTTNAADPANAAKITSAIIRVFPAMAAQAATNAATIAAAAPAMTRPTAAIVPTPLIIPPGGPHA